MRKFYMGGLLFLSLNSFAQNNFLGIKSGIRNTWHAGPRYDYAPLQSSRYNSRTFATGGLTFETFLSKNFLLGLEFLYEPSGYITETVIDMQLGDPPYTLRNKFTFSQFSLPIVLGGSFGKTLYVNLHAGIVPSIFVKSKREETRTENGGRLLGSQMVVIKKNNALDIGYLIGGHIGYKINSRSKLQATVRYGGNFTTRVIDEYIYLQDYKYSAVTFTAGYLYALTPHTYFNQPGTGDLLLSKSKRQRTTGLILIGTGAALGIAGGLIQLTHEMKRDNSFNFDFTGATIAIAGGVLLATGVVFYIRSNGLHRKAIGSSRGTQ